MTTDLFAELQTGTRLPMGEQAWLLHGFALPRMGDLLPALDALLRAAPLRHMTTPGGLAMSVATTSCGVLGWVSDRRGYRYAARDPVSGNDWPAMPPVFAGLARDAAAAAGFDAFAPDSCLINRYVPGTRLTLHQDRDERDFAAPIVSVSLGLPAVFLFGGHARSDKAVHVPLAHGDVAVWGGVDRLRFHGVLPVKPGCHPVMGAQRINLTFRRAG
ncbi:alpha-ketoglutarate-dependent dioxygenase [Lysobacter concretionis Ko07 = DSM 16239]|uniref:Alpha-ketoglutarate-dependent dioxygenase n=1 Tax=Lysobacter concretionis Ko07 = DSM 16239 TaxID=1122185 RepID=A0A0A0EMF3_9GAMM|nr:MULTISPECIES: DNA oxidative demethylase AlkB [Lysobacter]KGM51293.1 alpha-ketoglutarate-dependent dioxygenase [Lysobacter concretionis Ko07 = DSM 16239]QOD90998.1 DNA oxidative demethylase AlkB [Lysobacter sp. CW239]